MTALLRYTAIIVCIYTCASCNFHEQEDAQKLSIDLSVVNDSLLYYGKTWNEELKVAVNTLNFTKLKPIRTGLENYIDRKINDISKMQDINGSRKLREAELDILAFEKKVVVTKFLVFEEYTDKTSNEEMTKSYESLLNMTEAEKDKVINFQKLQDEYAEKNGFPKAVGDIK